MKDFKQSINDVNSRMTGRTDPNMLNDQNYTVQEENEMPGGYGNTNRD